MEIPIKDFIDSDIVTVTSSTTIADAGRKMTDMGIDSILVMDNGKFSGIITQKDVMQVIYKEKNPY